MVIPALFPDDVLRSELMQIDYETMARYLDEFQRKRPEWDVFRAKIPEALLEKWGRVIRICRENGFIAPMAIDGKIVFQQVKSHVRNRKNSDRCTMCQRNIKDGTCRGKLTNIYGRREFVVCWNMPSGHP